MSNLRKFIGCIFVLLLPTIALSQINDLRMPVIIDADRTDYDGKKSMLKFTGLRLTQGGIGIEADEALSSRMDFDDSVWKFSGNVVFDVNEGHVTCESADLEFSNFELQVATISGSPATFEFKRPGNEESTYAEAGNLVYDVARGVIEFSGGATITEGGNQISSETLVYNIKEQRINAASSGNGDDRVTVKYTPSDTAAENGAETTPERSEQPPASTDAVMPNEMPDEILDEASDEEGSAEPGSEATDLDDSV